jgi:hypothetical protein
VHVCVYKEVKTIHYTKWKPQLHKNDGSWPREKKHGGFLAESITNADSVEMLGGGGGGPG